MRCNKLWYGVLLFVCFACNKQKAIQSAMNDDYPTDSIKTSSSINLGELGITGVDIISWADSMFVIHQGYDSQNPIYCFNGHSVIKGASMGQGPDDVLEINSLKWSRDEGLYLYDGLKGRICFFQIDDSTLLMKKTIEVPRLLDDAVIIDNHVLVFPNTKEYSVAIIGENGVVIDSLTYFPPKPAGISPQVHALACTGTTAELPTGEFVRCVAYDGGVDFYMVEDNKLKHINRFSLFDMEYGQINQGMTVPVPSEESKTGFSMVKSSLDKFYAAFSDKLTLENPDGLCDRIYQFNKKGELEHVYILDCEFKDFAVNTDNTEMYILTDKNDNEIIKSYILH